jgi:hypothetical protein
LFCIGILEPTQATDEIIGKAALFVNSLLYLLGGCIFISVRAARILTLQNSLQIAVQTNLAGCFLTSKSGESANLANVSSALASVFLMSL